MSNTTQSGNRPTHRVYAIARRGEKSRWHEIGAAWPHGDGRGFSVKLDYLPLNGAEIALRVPDSQTDQDSGVSPSTAETAEGGAA